MGLRSPYLETKGEVFDVLAENDFLYDRWVGAGAVRSSDGGLQGSAQTAEAVVRAAQALSKAGPSPPFPHRCSTLIEEGTGNSITRGMDERVFPFTLDDGVPINCGWCAGRAGGRT